MEENLLAGGAIIGIVNATQMQFPQVKGFWALLLSIGLGVGMGALKLFGVEGMEQGLIVSLASSGVYKLSQNPKKAQ